MAKKLDPKIAEVLKEHGHGPEACWDCHGTWVVYHRVLEQIAASANIRYDDPQIIEANGGASIAALSVRGWLGERSEWSIGEASPKNNKNAYPWAMAEKRAKDRVVLKLIGLHGLAYSEEEADDFKNSAPKQEAEPAQPEAKPAAKQEPQKPEPVDWHEYAKGLRKAILTSPTEQALDEVLDVNRDNMTKLKTVSQPASDAINEAINARRATLKEAA
jgi:hypothetical protein